MPIAKQTLILALLCLGDLALTLYLIQVHGWSEGNPLMVRVLAAGVGPFVFVKLASFVPALALAEWYRRRHRRLVERVLTVVAIAYVLLYVGGVALANSHLWLHR